MNKKTLVRRIRKLEARARKDEWTAKQAEALLKRVLSIFNKFQRDKDAETERVKIGRLTLLDYDKKGSGVAGVSVYLGFYEGHPINKKSLIRQIGNAAGTKLRAVSTSPRLMTLVGDSGFSVSFVELHGGETRIDFSQEYNDK
jgi:hypothetical protein